MDYKETIDFLYASLPMFHRVGPAALKPGLENISRFCNSLGNPHLKYKTIHIAGTNGKGSSSHMLAAILQQAGYKTGLYTSPHLKDLTERIRVNGKPIPQQKVVDFVQSTRSQIETIQPSFFEMVCAMAFAWFAEEKVDVAVIEVGLGGRLDSTNIVQPDACLITNISFDHQQLLGNTLPAIAGEKAGIIKENVPVVVSEFSEETAEVFEEKAREKNAPLIFASEHYSLQSYHYSKGLLEVNYLKEEDTITVRCGLAGKYQLKNIAGVLTMTDVLKQHGYKISQENIDKGLREVVPLTGLKGRWQIIAEKPLTICDTAHNEAGINNVMSQLLSLPYRKLYLVFGVVQDKDVQKILSLLPKDAYYYFCQPQLPRALDAEELHRQALQAGLHGEVIRNVNEALKQARRKAGPEDIIYVGGSTFVVADVEEL